MKSNFTSLSLLFFHSPLECYQCKKARQCNEKKEFVCFAQKQIFPNFSGQLSRKQKNPQLTVQLSRKSVLDLNFLGKSG